MGQHYAFATFGWGFPRRKECRSAVGLCQALPCTAGCFCCSCDYSRVLPQQGVTAMGYLCSGVFLQEGIAAARRCYSEAQHSPAGPAPAPHCSAQPMHRSGSTHCWGSACLSTFAQQCTEEVMCLLQNSIWNRGVKRHNIHLWAPRSVCQTISDLADPHHPPSPHA